MVAGCSLGFLSPRQHLISGPRWLPRPLKPMSRLCVRLQHQRSGKRGSLPVFPLWGLLNSLGCKSTRAQDSIVFRAFDSPLKGTRFDPRMSAHACSPPRGRRFRLYIKLLLNDHAVLKAQHFTMTKSLAWSIPSCGRCFLHCLLFCRSPPPQNRAY